MSLKRSQGSGLGGAGDSGGALASFYDYEIEQSIRLNSGVLTFTPSSAGDRETWTWSAWVKRSNLGGNATLFCDAAGAYNLKFHTDNKIKFEGAHGEINTSHVYRDTSSWYHIVAIHDTTEGTASNRFKIFVNGVQQTTSGSYPSGEGVINNTTSHGLGGQTSANYFDGYMAEVHFIDGTAVAATSFGETKDGVWIPIEYSGSHGSQGWYLPFDDSSAIGDDESANTNDWSTSGLAATDVVKDSPTNNFPTMNALHKSSGNTGTPTFSEGNLASSFASNTITMQHAASMALPTTGKWYWEQTFTGAATDGSQAAICGIWNDDAQDIGSNNRLTTTSDAVTFHSDNNKIYSSADGSIGNTAYTGSIAEQTGAVVSFAVDMDNTWVWVAVNGTWINGTPDFSDGSNRVDVVSDTNGNYIPFWAGDGGGTITWRVNFGQDSANISSAQSPDNGIGTFEYDVPSDYKALCASNLPNPTIGPNVSTQADDHFNVIAYTGNGSTQSITGVGFEPDLVWIKNISSSHPNVLTDSVRGVTKEIQSESSTATESTNADGLTAFGADGFSLGDDDYYNYNSNSFISFSWKAATTASGTESGSNPAYSSSSNSTAGVSIVAYTGTGSTGTVSHGAGVVPKMILIKNRDVGDNWAVYHAGTASDPETDYLILNTNAAVADSANWWNDTAPTSSVFTVSTDHSVNADGEKYIAYVFAEVSGFSKFGTYEGNGNAAGSYIYTGFSPKWVLTKSVDSTSNWHIHDVVRHSENPNDAFSYADTVNIGAGAGTDFLSNGFKHRQSSDSNVSETYVYAAFAEAPFKYANAR